MEFFVGMIGAVVACVVFLLLVLEQVEAAKSIFLGRRQRPGIPARVPPAAPLYEGSYIGYGWWILIACAVPGVAYIGFVLTHWMPLAWFGRGALVGFIVMVIVLRFTTLIELLRR